MIFVNSFVVAEPFQPVRDCGTVVSHAGTTPEQFTLFSVGELVAAFVVSITKHTNLSTPSVANFGSLSWYIVIQLPAVRPVPVGTAPPTGKMFNWVVSMRALFQLSGSQLVWPWWAPAESSPGFAMYWPQNEASPGVTTPAWFVGTCSSTPVGVPPGTIVRPAATW